MVVIAPSTGRSPSRKRQGGKGRQQGCFIFLVICFSVHYLYLVWEATDVPHYLFEIINTTEFRQKIDVTSFGVVFPVASFEDLMDGADADELLEAYGEQSRQFGQLEYSSPDTGDTPLEQGQSAAMNKVENQLTSVSQGGNDNTAVVNHGVTNGAAQMNAPQGMKDMPTLMQQQNQRLGALGGNSSGPMGRPGMAMLGGPRPGDPVRNMQAGPMVQPGRPLHGQARHQRAGPFTDQIPAHKMFLNESEVLPKDPSMVNKIGYDPNRTITFVHIGKSGGISLRSFTSLTCRLDQPTREDLSAKCIEETFPKKAVLSRQVKYYFHMHGYFRNQLQDSTTYLYILRHPVDRLISALRYSHPDNCHPELAQQKRFRPWGCSIASQAKQRGTMEHRAWSQCFPYADRLEDFAQNVISPFPPFNTSHLNLTTEAEREQTAQLCRTTARDLTIGKGPHKPGPHLFFNFGYYFRLTLMAFPEKEVFAIRTEHEWEDMNNLDLAIGGAGNYREDPHFSHGSEKYKDSRISTEGYHKLCCVLEKEIGVYRKVLYRAVNLDEAARKESMDKIMTSCGITSSFDEWQRQCRDRVQDDQKLDVRFSSFASAPAAHRNNSGSILFTKEEAEHHLAQRQSKAHKDQLLAKAQAFADRRASSP